MQRDIARQMEITDRLKLNQIIGKENLAKRLIQKLQNELRDLEEERKELINKEDL